MVIGAEGLTKERPSRDPLEVVIFKITFGFLFLIMMGGLICFMLGRGGWYPRFIVLASLPLLPLVIILGIKVEHGFLWPEHIVIILVIALVSLALSIFVVFEYGLFGVLITIISWVLFVLSFTYLSRLDNKKRTRKVKMVCPECGTPVFLTKEDLPEEVKCKACSHLIKAW